MKKWKLAALVMFIAVNISVIMFAVRNRRGVDANDVPKVSRLEELQYTNPAFLEVETRLNAQIQALRRETLSESCQKLNLPGAYYWPGGIREAGVFSLSKGVDCAASVADIERILSSRRFHKVYFALKSDGAETASRLLKKELSVALVDYASRFSSFISQRAAAKPGELDVVSLKIGKFSHEKGEEVNVTITGARLKVLAIVLLMGLLECRECESDITGATAMALKQYAKFITAADTESKQNSGKLLIVNVGLYCPSVFATSLLAMSPGRRDEKTLEDSFVERSYPLTHFDALVSHFDQHRRVGAVALDDRKGVDKVHVVVCKNPAGAYRWLQARVGETIDDK